jgi:hypothetical protein
VDGRKPGRREATTPRLSRVNFELVGVAKKLAAAAGGAPVVAMRKDPVSESGVPAVIVSKPARWAAFSVRSFEAGPNLAKGRNGDEDTFDSPGLWSFVNNFWMIVLEIQRLKEDKRIFLEATGLLGCVNCVVKQILCISQV